VRVGSDGKCQGTRHEVCQEGREGQVGLMKVAEAFLTAVRCMNEPVTTFYGGAARSVVMRREWRRRSNAVRLGFLFILCPVVYGLSGSSPG